MFKLLALCLCAVGIIAKWGEQVQAVDKPNDLNDEENRLLQMQEELKDTKFVEEGEDNKDVSDPLIFMSQKTWFRTQLQRILTHRPHNRRASYQRNRYRSFSACSDQTYSNSRYSYSTNTNQRNPTRRSQINRNPTRRSQINRNPTRRTQINRNPTRRTQIERTPIRNTPL